MLEALERWTTFIFLEIFKLLHKFWEKRMKQEAETRLWKHCNISLCCKMESCCLYFETRFQLHYALLPYTFSLNLLSFGAWVLKKTWRIREGEHCLFLEFMVLLLEILGEKREEVGSVSYSASISSRQFVYFTADRPLPSVDRCSHVDT
jgi:hypothetical protein